jgi:hypothetical protein
MGTTFVTRNLFPSIVDQSGYRPFGHLLDPGMEAVLGPLIPLLGRSLPHTPGDLLRVDQFGTIRLNATSVRYITFGAFKQIWEFNDDSNWAPNSNNYLRLVHCCNVYPTDVPELFPHFPFFRHLPLAFCVAVGNPLESSWETRWSRGSTNRLTSYISRTRPDGRL